MSEFEKARDEAADDGKWMGGSHGRAVHGAWISGANWAEHYMLERDERVRGLVEALRFYAENKHWRIDHATGVLISCDSHEKDFSGAKAIEALQIFEREREGMK